ncbi:MAG: hypothetical protein GY948_07205 [Alphaproteobacteria bacterium]|nr:hypothetical protein [Alphaproteobacteria bacterium]
MTPNLFTGWTDRHTALFGNHTIKLGHRLAETGLFSEEAIAALIDEYPEDKYNLNSMGPDPRNKVWREGNVAGNSGKQVLQAISKGRMWINLRRVMEVDPRYDALLNEIFAEFEALVPGLHTYRHNLGILVSSPGAQVYYHADIPGQALWQIAGRKRVYLYPNTAPFLEPESIENIVMGTQEEEMPFETWFDAHAEIHDLKPGDMLHWPLNGPHRVVNEDCLNISVTTEHWSNDIRNAYAVNYANGILRNHLGYAPRNRDTSGLSVYPKAALTLAWKKMKLNKASEFVRKIDFHIDPARPNGMQDVAAYLK